MTWLAFVGGLVVGGVIGGVIGWLVCLSSLKSLIEDGGLKDLIKAIEESKSAL